jgi:hypothetical protein
MTDTLSFSDFLRRELGTSRWCVSPRLTQRLREKGYEAAVSQKRMNFLQEQWERERYGALLVQLHDAAPALLEACRTALANLKPKYPSNHLVIQQLTAAIAAAEGTKP